ncbi:MAG: hypothetical protein V1929_13245 [bacterium]
MRGEHAGGIAVKPMVRLLLCIGSLTVGACNSTFKPPQSPPELESRPAPPDINVFATPHELREDYVYPPDGTRQIIRWTDREEAWIIYFSSRRYSYAGIVMKKPYDFTRVKDDSYLTFRVKPAYMANYLSVGLVDGDIASGHVLADVPLVRGPALTVDGERTFRVPLPDFGDTGFAVTTATEPSVADRLPFDWSDVREIRFSTFGKIPRKGIVITDVHFRR